MASNSCTPLSDYTPKCSYLSLLIEKETVSFSSVQCTILGGIKLPQAKVFTTITRDYPVAEHWVC